ncbi:MAG: polysaccharide deacetylase family protein [Saprospiraceae bacterium]
MIPFKHLFAALIIAVVPFAANGQQDLATRLGYDAGAKMLIIHADDAGVAHSVNAATIGALEAGGITSASIMVPCPWFPEIAAYAAGHPSLDFGLHLTLTSEWKNYKWGGVLPAAEIPGLVGADGYFYPSVEEVVKHATAAEVEREIRAQVERALAFGIKPSHLDSHMGTLFATPEFLAVYLKVGQEYGIPVFVPLHANGKPSGAPPVSAMPGVIPVDNFYMMNPGIAPEDWSSFYAGIAGNLQPGLSEIIVHLAHDNEEMQAVAAGHPDYGAAWRQRDYDVMLNESFKKQLAENGIILVTWRQIQDLLHPEKN